MTNKIPLVFIALMSLLPFYVHAESFSSEALQGNWIYSHILLEDGTRIDVNRLTEFTADGQAIFHDPLGKKNDVGTYEVSGSFIHYSDSNGPQPWEVIEFDEQTLHVDHRGAQMFFKRPDS